MVVKCGEWLTNQQYRADLIGDLARVLCTKNIDDKPQKRGPDEQKIWVDIVIGIPERDTSPFLTRLGKYFSWRSRV